MSNLNTNFDNDFDSFLNLETNDFTPIVSPSTRSVPLLSQQSSQQSFAGPSYQYDSHRQQTGLPMGGLANVLAVNQASGMHFRPNSMGYVMPTETLNIPLASNLDDFDYNTNQSIDMNDMDFDADSPTEASMFYPGNGESSQSAPVQRIYPGMHSQQAAQAKAAQALKQQEIMKQRHQKQLSGQQALPTQPPKAPAAKDPHVEESISRLLQRMRQSSSASMDDDGASSVVGMGGLGRTKKEEDDMDEDERLLASEEGKKLSSKERRQLRNKVSARAFRSRRKEYITQLEAEVQQKVQEANDLRVQNRQLMEENTRLTDLTRMLLSSQSFSGFLQELSNSGLPAPQINVPAMTRSSQASQVQVPKDIGVHEAARQLQSQNQPQVNMAMIPEHPINMGSLDNWNTLPSNDFQVFAVTAVPRPVGLDLAALTEQSSVDQPAKLTPNLPTLPVALETRCEPLPTTMVDESIELDKDLFELYYTSPTTTPVSIQTAQSLIASLEKPIASEDGQVGEAAADVSDAQSQLSDLCDELEKACERVSKFMPHMK